MPHVATVPWYMVFTSTYPPGETKATAVSLVEVVEDQREARVGVTSVQSCMGVYEYATLLMFTPISGVFHLESCNYAGVVSILPAVELFTRSSHAWQLAVAEGLLAIANATVTNDSHDVDSKEARR